MTLKGRVFHFVSRFVGKITGRYYFEDYERVYPEDMRFDKLGRQMNPTQADINNFKNHGKFYLFAGQFVKDKRVADVGCGSGYGSEVLKNCGAGEICGTDISRHAIRFASSRFGHLAKFTEQKITDMSRYEDSHFDVVICSEVLEHLKEYRMEEAAVAEMKRITRQGGVLIIGTPNSEMLPDHGFSFEEIQSLMDHNFDRYVIFENALIPFKERKEFWRKRLEQGKTGVIISENINLKETVLLESDGTPELKQGIEPGIYDFEGLQIDTTLLHNTHSWGILAIN
ncbi:class I SAM-dependent methyltransferase [Acidobacteriota bacterium]